MADGERRMLFDIRGRRKHVIRVVYAILALLMGASLFLVVGPVNIGELINGSSTEAGNAAKIYEERAEQLEHKLKKNPTDAALLLGLSQAQLRTGEALSERGASGEAVLGVESKSEYEKALDTWARYLKVAGDEPAPNAASGIATASFTLAQNSRTYDEAFEHLDAAVQAQGIAAEARPTLGTLTVLAAFQMLRGDFKAGEKTGKEAEALANTKQEKKQISKQLAAYEKSGKSIQKERKAAAKAEKSQGKEKLENPLGGLGSSTSGLTTTP
jgi:hypothetical protein